MHKSEDLNLTSSVDLLRQTEYVINRHDVDSSTAPAVILIHLYVIHQLNFFCLSIYLFIKWWLRTDYVPRYRFLNSMFLVLLVQEQWGVLNCHHLKPIKEICFQYISLIPFSTSSVIFWFNLHICTHFKERWHSGFHSLWWFGFKDISHFVFGWIFIKVFKIRVIPLFDL